MKLADCRILSLLVILVLLWISGTDSQTFTERQHENGRRNEVQKRGFYWCWKHCSRLANCIYLVGGTHCRCKQGFTGNGYTCTDIDECYKTTANCDAREFCTNTFGSYKCSCKTGFERNEETGKCDDINECERRTDNCNKTYTYCKNTIGLYSCSCKTGFEPWSNDCRNINECLRNTHVCSAHASCTDTWGSYTCSCRTGFEGNGRICNVRNR